MFLLKAAFCARLIVPDEYAKEGKDDTTILGMQKKTSKLEVLMVSGRRESSCENYWVLPGGYYIVYVPFL
jgi:hypothetical protein